MYTLVVGGGKVGYHLAKQLVAEGHEVLVIEKDAKKCEHIAEELGAIVLRGDGCEAATLADAGTGRADMVIAVTGDDEDNLIVCQVAKCLFHVGRTIARINNPKNETIFRKLGIDYTVSSTNIILEQIEHELPSHPLTRLLNLKHIGLEIVEIKIGPDSPAVGKHLRQITLPPDCRLALVINKQSGAIIPTGDTVLSASDEILAVAKTEAINALRTVLAGK
ncbi:MAG: TrkA family potassium uptake protein [Dehalococcoidia bacterium]|nr:TrkA family potassium uptake protein [Dehalococcoidia bacterium]